MEETWGSTCMRYITKFHSNDLFTVLLVVILRSNKGLNANTAIFQMFDGCMDIQNTIHFTLNRNKHYHVLVVYEYVTRREVHGA